MDSQSLYYSLELVAGGRCVLNVEEITTLQTSLVILKKNYKFNRVLFWGKIMGLKQYYVIAQGRGQDELKDRTVLYSFNCMEWFLLPPVTDVMIQEVSKAAKGQFMGDPSYIYEKMEEEDMLIKVSEENRLAVTVHLIDKEVSLVPRGAFIKAPNSLVQINRGFGGLSESESKKLDNFLHFREPMNPKKSVLEMSRLNPAIDFLDELKDDIPKGSWLLQFECAGRVCVIRSLLWLGLTFYHVPMTPQHGYIYTGDGTKNLDLPFML